MLTCFYWKVGSMFSPLEFRGNLSNWVEVNAAWCPRLGQNAVQHPLSPPRCLSLEPGHHVLRNPQPWEEAIHGMALEQPLEGPRLQPTLTARHVSEHTCRWSQALIFETANRSPSCDWAELRHSHSTCTNSWPTETVSSKDCRFEPCVILCLKMLLLIINSSTQEFTSQCNMKMRVLMFLTTTTVLSSESYLFQRV